MRLLPITLYVCGLLCLPSLTRAQVPTPEAFTVLIEEALVAEAPASLAHRSGVLSIMATRATDQTLTLSLDRLYAACQTNPAECGTLRSQYVTRAGVFLREQPATPTKASLRMAIRPAANMAGLPVALKLPVLNTLPGGLVGLLYFDLPTTMMLVGPAQLKELGLSYDEAVAAALANTTEELGPLDPAIEALAPGEAAGFKGGAYESSRLLYPQSWAGLASRFGGKLLVAFPSAEEVLCANGSGAEALPQLIALARMHFAKAERPTSPDVFEWQPTGWRLVTPAP